MARLTLFHLSMDVRMVLLKLLYQLKLFTSNMQMVLKQLMMYMVMQVTLSSRVLQLLIL